MKKHKIAVLGAGLIGRVHIEKLLANPRTTLALIIDPSSEAEIYSHSIGVPYAKDVLEGFKAHKIDGAIVATPNHLHVPHGLLCVEFGIPALIEKPFADSVMAGEKLVQASLKAGVALLTGHHRRHNPIIKKAKAIIDSGVLGDIVTVQSATLHYKPEDYWEQGQWRTKKGGGPVLINLIHDVDLLRHLVGEVVDIQAMGSNARRGFEVEDTAAVVMRFANGALGSLIISDFAASTKSWEQTSGEAPQYPHTKDEDYMSITGTKGTLGIPTLTLKTYGDKKPSWYSIMEREVVSVENQDPLVNQINNLCNVIEGRALPLVSAQEGLKTLQMVEKIKGLIGFA